MKPSKTVRIAQWIIACSFVFWLCETAYFGWNLKPINIQEAYCDWIVETGFSFGLILMFLPAFNQYMKWIKEH